MKQLLYLTSITLLSIVFQSCNSNNKAVSKEAVSADSTATSIDTVKTSGDTLSAIAKSSPDSLDNKDEKYDKDTTEKHEAPEHQTPDQAKLDSIKKAKGKKKKNKD